MEEKKITQYGMFQIIISGIIITYFSLKSYNLGFLETSGLMYAGLSALMLLCILLTYKIVIEIDENKISLMFGIGLFKRAYQFDNLVSCTSVRCSLMSGFGIRRISNGWLYNISGLDAIELKFKDKKNIIRIGTNESDEIASLISNLIKQHERTNESSQLEYTSYINWEKWISLFVVALFGMFFLYTIKNDGWIFRIKTPAFSG